MILPSNIRVSGVNFPHFPHLPHQPLQVGIETDSLEVPSLKMVHPEMVDKAAIGTKGNMDFLWDALYLASLLGFNCLIGSNRI